MRLYNKRGFFSGLTFCACGILDLILIFTGFLTLLWFWFLDAAVLFYMGGRLILRALSQEQSRRDLTENWNIGQTVIYNKYGFLDGVWLLLCAAGSLVTALTTELGWRQNIYTVLLLYFGLDRIVRAVTLEDAKKDLVEERDERNRMVILKAQAMSFQITQVASLLLMCFFVLRGGRFNQVDLVSAGLGASLCFLISLLSGFFTRKYYEKHL